MKEYGKNILAAVVTMLFMSIYTTIDGMYVSKCVNTDAMAAINISYPIVNIMFAIGFGLSIGGSTRIAYAFGEKNNCAADKRFTVLIITGLSVSCIMAGLLFAMFNPILKLLGATEKIIDYCRIYAGIAILSYPIGIMKEILAAVMRTQTLAGMSMMTSIVGGVVNIILDYYFINICKLGVFGAATATTIGMMIALLMNIYFVIKKDTLHICRIEWREFNEVLKIEKLSRSCGILELSYAVTIWIFNQIALFYRGESGVAAYTVIGYIQYALAAVFIGIGNGASPIISECYGAEDNKKMNRLMRFSFVLSIVCGIGVTVVGFLFSGVMTGIFIRGDSEIYIMAQRGIKIIAFSYLPMSINVIVACVLNACGRGKRASLLTLLRTVVFLVLAAILLSGILNIVGIWIAYVITEIMTLPFSYIFYRLDTWEKGEKYIGQTKYE